MIPILRNSLAIVALTALPVLVHAQDVTGLWRTEPNDVGYLEIQIQTCGAAICGTIVQARNLEGEIGPYEHIGRRMIWDMTPAGEAGVWDSGKIWDPRNGRTYNSNMSLEAHELTVAGCFLGICQSQTWERVR